jgi:5-methylcytosine-specific restriction endonuclease McrA
MTAVATAVRRSYRTLVLNADYRPLSTWPLSVVPAEDAISTLWRDRADVVDTWEDAFFHSPSIRLPVPKVIALKSYAPIASAPKFCRRSILLRDRYRCQYCGHRFDAADLTFDHVIPRSAGGKTEWSNILSACIPCNKAKRDRMPNYSARRRDKGEIRPLKQPRQPRTAELLRAGLEFLDPKVREDYGSWLYFETELLP